MKKKQPSLFCFLLLFICLAIKPLRSDEISSYAQFPDTILKSEVKDSDSVLHDADDAILQIPKDNVAAVKFADRIFDAAHFSLCNNDFDKAEFYFKKALTLKPMKTYEQLLYSKLLYRKGETAKAKGIATQIFQTSESQYVLSESSSIISAKIPHSVLPFTEKNYDTPVICFVPFGDVDDWIIQYAGKRISETLGVSVYIYPKKYGMTDPQRSGYADLLTDIRKDINWYHPFVSKKMKQMGITDREQMKDKEVMELYLYLLNKTGAAETVKNISQFTDYIQQHQQWDVDILFRKLINYFAPKKLNNVIYIGLTQCDIYMKDNNYLFGAAKIGYPYGIVSYARFRAGFNDGNENKKRFLDRLHKQLLSSIGMTLNVPRPTDPYSARSYPNSLEEHDAKGTWLSPSCIAGFEKGLGHSLPKATKRETRKALGEE